MSTTSPLRNGNRRGLRFARTALTLLLLGTTVVACRPGRSVTSTASGSKEPTVEPLNYIFPGVSGGPVEASSHRGRTTVLLFITTFDVFSQAQASRLEDLVRSRRPRINAAAVVLEAPRNAALVASFAEVLDLSYPVAVADSRELVDHEFFRNIKTVPAWVFLDADGRPQAVGSGALTLDKLNELLDGFVESRRGLSQ